MTYEECAQLVTVRDQLADFAASLIHKGVGRTDV